MHIRYENRIADTDAGIIRVFESINKAKKAMRGNPQGRVADDHKQWTNMRRNANPNTKSYREVTVCQHPKAYWIGDGVMYCPHCRAEWRVKS